MTVMNDELYEKCNEIIQEIIDNPLADIFVDPVDTTIVTDYLKVIKDPQDLSTIKKRLEKKEYYTLDSFLNETNLVWDNAVKYNGQGTLYAEIAIYFSKKFNKKINGLPGRGTIHWINRVNFLIRKINNLVVKAPKEIRQTPYRQDQNPKSFKEFVRASKRFTSKSDISQILQILNAYGIDYNKETSGRLDIRLSDLPPVAFRALEKFAKEKYAEQGIEYPKV
ncbi:Bromodomain containing protein [Histomonas meleagridis]|uniref:Bromodomain containing protein n=1 Tax=Histomonas meleagridis TaxID=135588 RepID=UPI00355974AA|nr:Bromodomain containing protein [Histomonas meleagridis]KAH0807111.1 Bromodomain containing protein [Histomonas meleagridis]